MKNFTRAGWYLLTSLLLSSTAMAQSVGSNPNSKGVKTTTAVVSDSPSSYQTFVQGLRRVKPGFPVCGFSNVDANVSIPAPAEFLAARQNPNLRAAARSTFIVDYVGFSPQAQRAFQYAVDIWASIIDSPVPIRVSAIWTSLPNQVLGQASAFDFRARVNGAQKANSFYAIALAEKISRREINPSNEPDIEAEFNSDQSWYYGTDAKPGTGQFDLVTIVLHELGHGLGFTSFYGIPDGGTNASLAQQLPAVFDNFVTNGQDQLLLTTPTIFNDAAALNRALTGNDIFFTGPTTQKAKLYAPRTFSDASSISHLDEDTYRQGDPNSLMSPTANRAEAIHDPGPLVKSMFTDMEWKTTSVLHTPIRDTEDPKPIAFVTQVISDTGVNTTSPTLYISRGTLTNTTTFSAITLTRVGTTSTYSYTLPASQAKGRINYYFEAKDVTGKTYSNPGKSLAGNQVIYSFQVAPDNVAPTITRHVPANYSFIAKIETDTLTAIITDERNDNLDSVYVDYRVNGTVRPPVSMSFTGFARGDSAFAAVLPIARGTLRAGDVISYRLIAKDKSRAGNRRILPASGFYSTTIVAPASTTANSYNTTFSNAAAAAADFVGDGFSITQPTGFSDAAIHTTHPYANGDNIFYKYNYTYVLKTPIRIKANQDSATIRFDEVVLVEPGISTDYRDEDFFDYVIVEGSRDGGKTWLPFINGYDSRDQTVWLTAYNTAITTTTIISGGQPAEDQISTTAGRPNLFRKREFSMLDNGNFFPNQVVLIRFRLYVDQLARGWGWAVDNLQIQTPAAPIVLTAEPARNGVFTVSPNPTSGGFVRVDAELTTPATEAALSISSPTGQTLRQQSVSVKNGTTINESLDLSQLPNGLYFLRLQAGDSVQTRKLMIAK